jgi:putative membrane protein
MEFTITLNWIIQILLTGLAISIAAFLLPFVHVRNFGVAVLVGILIALGNQVIWWLLRAVGINVVGSGIGEALINFFIYVASIMLVDAVMKSFRVSGFLMAALFAVVVAVIQYFLVIVTATIF